MRLATSIALCSPLLLLQACSLVGEGEEHSISSPDGRLAITVAADTDAGIRYQITRDNAVVIAASRAALTFGVAEGKPKAIAPLGKVKVLSVTQRNGADRYVAVNGGSEPIVRRYSSVILHARETAGLGRKLDLEARAYDSGLAFRTIVPPQPGLSRVRIARETTDFRFPANYACLAVHQQEPSNSHEGEYAPVKAAALRPDGYYDLPLVCQTGRGGETLAISESGIENYAAAYLVAPADRRPGVAIKLTPLPDDASVAVETPMTTKGVASPWRVVMLADKPEALVESTLVSDLAAPSRVGDTSWIRPGKAAWGWWSGLLARGVADPGHNDATYRYYIDFARRFGVPYYLIDRGWAWRNASGDGDDPIADITRTTDGVNMPALVRYARDRNVRLWLWVNWKALDGRMDEAFSLYQRLGVVGIKVDYLYRQDQHMVAFYHRLLATAAKYRLMVDIHASFVPRGLERTYPNFMTSEAAMGSEYNRWSRRVTARHNVSLAYTRAVVGPMDYAPGAFRNVAPSAFKARNQAPMVMTTRAHQLAQFVAYPSPLGVLADAPSAYEDGNGASAPGADFLRRVPTQWDETRGIAGEFGRTIAIARRSGRTWFVGVLNDETARDLAIPLAFLGEGAWRVASWSDGDAPDRVVARVGEVKAGDGHLVVSLAAGGGAALVLNPAT